MIERAAISDAPEIARIFRRSFQAALPFLPTLHTDLDSIQLFH